VVEALERGAIVAARPCGGEVVTAAGGGEALELGDRDVADIAQLGVAAAAA
jgi:hypothetical protein